VLCCSSSKYQCIKFIKKTDSVLEIIEGQFSVALIITPGIYVICQNDVTIIIIVDRTRSTHKHNKADI